MMRRIVRLLFLFSIGILIGAAFFPPTKERSEEEPGALKPDVTSAFNRDLSPLVLQLRTREGDEAEVATCTSNSSDLHILRRRHKGDHLLALQRQFARDSIFLVYGTLEEQPPLELQEKAKVVEGTNNVSWLRSWLHSAYAHRLSRRANEDPRLLMSSTLNFKLPLYFTRRNIYSGTTLEQQPSRGKGKADHEECMHMLDLRLLLGNG